MTRTTGVSRAVESTASEPTREVQQESPRLCSRKLLPARSQPLCRPRCSETRRHFGQRCYRSLGSLPFPSHLAESWSPTSRPSTARAWSPETRRISAIFAISRIRVQCSAVRAMASVYLRWQLTADHNERPKTVYYTISPDRNYWEVINLLFVLPIFT